MSTSGANLNRENPGNALKAASKRSLLDFQKPDALAEKYRVRNKMKNKQIRYAVVGLGHIAQAAVLPAFRHARKNSKLTALVSDDPLKLKELSKRYNVEHVYSYAAYDDCLRSGNVDAVYIALPNNQHREFSIRAALAGVHILCEKPMAVTNDECIDMINAAKENNVKLMVAYRLHFEQANLEAIKIARTKIGDPRIFNSVFTVQVKKGNIRTKRDLGGGTVRDLGIYCLNAARYIFRDEPIEVMATSAHGHDTRFKEVDEMTSAILRFPNDRLATFTSSFGAADTGSYEVIGTKGVLRVDPAYEYAIPLSYKLTIDGKTKTKNFPKRDQFAPELAYFSQCILSNKQPEPSGIEGLNDVEIINAIYESAKSRRSVILKLADKRKRPTEDQEMTVPGIEKPPMIHAEASSD